VSAGYGQAFATGRLFGWMSQSFRGEGNHSPLRWRGVGLAG